MQHTSTPSGIDSAVDCPCCRVIASRVSEAPGWGHWYMCPECSLEFASPMALNERPEVIYDAAYRGQRHESVMEEFHDRLAIREAIAGQPELWFWTPAFEKVLAWLKERYREGATFLELGSGLGFFLHAARKQGLNPVGLDVALAAVELNRRDGFQVWHGTLDSLPKDWVQPDAVVAFFMLHHLERPLDLLQSIRSRWPNAGVAIAQYGPSNRDAARSTPPRTLTRWNGLSMQKALQAAGYQATIHEFPSSGSQRGVLRPLRKVFKRSIVLPRFYRSLRRFENKVLSRLLTPLAKEAYVVLAFAEAGSEVSRAFPSGHKAG